MKRRHHKVISCFILLILLILFIQALLLHYPHCEKVGLFVNEVFAYDSVGLPISRKESIVAGKAHLDKVHLIIGIPTVYREHNHTTAFYLGKTIQSLISPLSSEQRKLVKIFVMMADQKKKKKTFIYNRMKNQFTNEIKDGTISILEIPNRFYLDLHDIRPTHHDSPERMYWRSKQSLDYAFIFQYVHNLCSYYLQIEDDVLADSKYFSKIIKDIERLNHVANEKPELFPDDKSNPKYKPWTTSEYYRLGFIGRLIPAQYLPLLSSFVKVYYSELPVDWGYPHLWQLIGIPAVANLELFTHIGNQSSSLGT